MSEDPEMTTDKTVLIPLVAGCSVPAKIKQFSIIQAKLNLQVQIPKHFNCI